MISLKVIKNPNGVIVYQGPSAINNAPIVAIATGIGSKPSENIKTGELIQVWIIHSRIQPIKALYSGRDEAVCGDCKHSLYGTCYVNLGQGVNGVYGGFRRGNYPKLTPAIYDEHFVGKKIRLGAYGDPVAVPMEVWNNLLEKVSGHTGYTHQWRKSFAQGHKSILMASVDNAKEFSLARNMGWRTFRTRMGNEALFPREFECPASKEQGNRLTCEECMACNGGDKLATVSIIAHGPKWKMNKYMAMRKLQNQKKSMKELRIR